MRARGPGDLGGSGVEWRGACAHLGPAAAPHCRSPTRRTEPVPFPSPSTPSAAEQQQHLQSAVAQLERELGRLQAELATWQPLKAGCEEAHGVREKVSCPAAAACPVVAGVRDRLSGCLSFISLP